MRKLTLEITDEAYDYLAYARIALDVDSNAEVLRRAMALLITVMKADKVYAVYKEGEKEIEKEIIGIK